jgi:hypothetical protein
VPKPPQSKVKDIARRLRRSRPGSSKRWLGSGTGVFVAHGIERQSLAIGIKGLTEAECKRGGAMRLKMS